MIHDIIKTDNYLIIVDDSEIKGWYYDFYINKVKHSGGAEYVENGITKKIIAHLPLNTSPVLEGVDLLLPLEDGNYPVAFEQEDEVINETYTLVTRKSDSYTIWIGKYIY